MTTLSFRVVLLLILVGVVVGCGGKTNLAYLDARELFDLGMEKYRKGKHVDAIEAFQAAIFNYPGESLVDTAQYYLGLSYYDRDYYVLAQVEFNRLLLNYPASVFAPQAQLMKAVCFFKGTPKHYGLDQTDLETAVRQFEDFLVDYPESDAVEEARAYLGQARMRLARKLYESGIVYARVADFRAARIYFQKVIDDYTNTEYGANATYQIAESYYQEKNWAEAHERFENFRIVFADHVWSEKAARCSCVAAYKGGEKALEAGDYALARERFERYRLVCGQNEKKLRQVEEYLQSIGDIPVVKVDSANAGS